jgi:RNA polymerase sigma-70 factor (ECF subfamily)
MSELTTVVNWSELLQSARRGDDSALNQVWQELRSYLLIIAHQRLDAGLRGKMDASDVVQQSLMDAHQGFDEFRGESEGEIKAWTCRLVINNLVDAGRRFRQSQKRCISKEIVLTAESELAAVKYDTSPSTLLRQRETDDEMARAVSQLPLRSQQVLELRHRMGLSHAQVAVELGMTESGARKLWSRIVLELQERLSPQNVRQSTEPR